MTRKRFVKTWEVSISIEINQEDEPTGNEQEIRNMLVEEALNGSITLKPIGEIFRES